MMKLSLLFIFSCAAVQAGLDYSTILPLLGGSDASVTAMAVDADGNVYLTGVTAFPGFPATPGVIQPKFGGGACTYGIQGGSPFAPQQYFTCTDAFVVKLDSNGNIVFATFLGGSGQDRATSIAVDGAGNIYVAGISGSTNFPTADGSVFSSQGPAFIVKMNSSGTALLYSAFLSGTGPLPFLAPFAPNVPPPDLNVAITVDGAGNAWFAANATPGFPITDGALQSRGPIVVGKLDATGSQMIFGTYFGGTGFSSVSGIARDPTGNVYLTGRTCSTDFPVTDGALQTTLPDHSCAGFVAKFDANNTALIYATYFGGGSFPQPLRIRVNASGEAYVLGIEPGSQFPVTDGAFQSTWFPDSAFLTKLSADGTALVYSTFLHFPGTPASTLDVDAAGNAFVAGQTGPGFSASPNAFQPSYAGGGNDVYIAQFAPDGSLAAGTYLGGSSYENASAVASLPGGSVVVTGFTHSSDFPATAGSPLGFFATRLFITNDPR